MIFLNINMGSYKRYTTLCLRKTIAEVIQRIKVPFFGFASPKRYSIVLAAECRSSLTPRNDRKSVNSFSLRSPRSAFTLAEVILVLGIIGIVAEMTLPAVIQDAQDAQYKAGKDKVRMSIAEAGRVLSVTGEISSASSAQDFVENYLSKQLKITKFCDPTNTNIEQCGMPSGNPTTFKNLYNTNVASMPTTWLTMTVPNSVTGPAPASGFAPYSTINPTTQNFNDSYVFLTADGIAVNLFYNPYCASNFTGEKNAYDSPTYTYTKEKPQWPMDMACMSGVYDMNGLKKPNQVGRDIGFFGVFYNGLQSKAVAALPYKTGIDTLSMTQDQAYVYCRDLKGWEVPTLEELSALFLGRSITGLPSVGMLTAPGFPNGNDRLVDMGSGVPGWFGPSARPVRCVRE